MIIFYNKLNGEIQNILDEEFPNKRHLKIKIPGTRRLVIKWAKDKKTKKIYPRNYKHVAPTLKEDIKNIFNYKVDVITLKLVNKND